MEAPKNLRRPSNWQDFESLCKKLWGEIWKCPEIQKNGRLGQKQLGVDVFGIPSDDDGYYGIQCKNKSEYAENPQLTKKEIDEEIEEAKKFKPALKKLYLATTASNDAEIQQLVREKNLEHRSNGLFEVHVFAWESIVDLIEENKQTQDWYLKNQNYKLNQSVALTFQNGLTEYSCYPRFKQFITHSHQKIIPTINPLYSNPLLGLVPNFGVTPVITYSKTTENHSFIPIKIIINNTGDEPIEEYKILLDFEGEIQDLSDTNEKKEGLNLAFISKYIPNTSLWSETMQGKIIPKQKILVGDDHLNSEDIFIKPFPKESDIIIKWKLISKDFKDEGELILKVFPEIEKEYKYIFVEDPLKVGVKKGKIEDYIIEKK